jgi:hypothetical protein
MWRIQGKGGINIPLEPVIRNLEDRFNLAMGEDAKPGEALRPGDQRYQTTMFVKL